MKKTLIIISAILLVSLGLSTWGACAASYLVRHNSSTGRVLSTDSHAAGFDLNSAAYPVGSFFWHFGNGDAANSNTCSGPQNQVRFLGTAPNRFYFYNAGGDWLNGCTLGCPGTPPTGQRVTLVMWQNVGEGTINHKALWIAYTNLYNTTLGRFDYATITNGNPGPTQGCLPQNIIPQPTNVVDGSVPGATKDITLTWTAPTGGGTNGDMGFYDVAPPSAVIADYEIYYSFGAAPVTGAVASWTMWPTRAAGTATSMLLDEFPYGDGSQAVYFAIRPRFNYGAGTYFTFPFVSANSGAVGPTASTNVFATVSGSRTSATFTTNSESGVASFQAFYSTTENGKYAPASKIIPAIGGSQTYTVKLTIPVDTAKYIKIKANLTNGTSQWSNPTLIQ